MLTRLGAQGPDPDAGRRLLAGRASQAFPNGLGQIARPSDRRGVARRRPAPPAQPPAGQPQCPRDRRLYQRRAALGGRANPPRHPDADARGSAARLCRARRDQLPAGDRAGQHLGSGAGRARLQRRLARDARARRPARARAGGRRRPRPALGPDRGDLWRGSLSGQRDVAGGDPRLPGHERCRWRRTGCSSRSST